MVGGRKMAGKKVKQGQVMGLGEKTFNVFMVLLGILITFIALYPIYYVLISSFSKPFFVENGDVLLGIKEFTTASYGQRMEMLYSIQYLVYSQIRFLPPPWRMLCLRSLW